MKLQFFFTAKSIKGRIKGDYKTVEEGILKASISFAKITSSPPESVKCYKYESL